MKLTPWFPGTVKPVHVGVYERNYNSPSPHYCYWNGKRWSLFELNPQDAMNWKNTKSLSQNLSWRGLMK